MPLVEMSLLWKQLNVGTEYIVVTPYGWVNRIFKYFRGEVGKTSTNSAQPAVTAWQDVSTQQTYQYEYANTKVFPVGTSVDVLTQAQNELASGKGGRGGYRKTKGRGRKQRRSRKQRR